MLADACHSSLSGSFATRRARSPHGETLERREALAGLPFGASADDTAEFMLGDVLVSVVLLESNGTIDPDTENWRLNEIDKVKREIRDGLTWWEDLLAAKGTNHDLSFQLDFTHTDTPIETGYEPISRPSDDYALWIEDFFAEVGLTGSGSISSRIRQFNNQQRLAHDTHWAFTIFVVDAEADQDSWFDVEGEFDQSFAFAGGRYFVTTSERPASTIAHETAHMFWALDEYPGSRTYSERRGYYNTQNLNAYDGNPQTASRVRSIMDASVSGYALRAVSPSALEMIGWKDSDGNGVFDVLDVPHLLVGAGEFHPETREYTFGGFAQVQALPNLNSSGTGSDTTINEIDRVEVRFDDGAWQTVVEVGGYQADLLLRLVVPPDASRLELRVVDDPTGVSSNVLSEQFGSAPTSWRNPADPFDVSGDAFVTPLDALLVINQLNAGGSRLLAGSPATPPFLDVDGNGFLSPLDALLVINRLNDARDDEVSIGSTEASQEGEPQRATAAKQRANRVGELSNVVPRRVADRAELVDWALADWLLPGDGQPRGTRRGFRR